MHCYPMKLVPCYKDYLWGGNRLEELYGKKSDLPHTAESWELSCHKDGESIVENGDHSGALLSDVIMAEPISYLGARYQGTGFPILVKLLDATKNLSIQVHPSDQTALKEQGEQGKAELWYVLEAQPQSYIYYGFSTQITKEQLVQSVTDGSICTFLNRIEVKRGDIFYILPGTVHALCAGVVIAEIQQSSNTTFRIYDYNRCDTDGKQRALHLERAGDVIEYQPVLPHSRQMNNIVYLSDRILAEMFHCEYFSAYRLQVKNEATMFCSQESFEHLIFVDGAGYIECEAGKFPFQKGDSYFLPASLGCYKICGACTALLSMLSEEKEYGL